MEYLLKASTIIVIFYFCYSLFLQRDTFFQSNRWFFIVGLITAVLIPLVVIPVYITVQPQEFINSVSNLTYSNENTVTPFDWNKALITIYFLGVCIFAVRLLIQIYSLVSLIIRSKKQRSGKFIYVEVEDNISPFSFFNWIVFNPNQFKQIELEQIITHEKVHANQFHSIDILLIQIVSVVFWCNPLIWLYKKELHQNLEFIADNEAQKQSSCEKSYQHLLLKTSMPNYQMALTNNFYNSLIKKRIIMLHKSRSNKFRIWKYILILPLLALFLMNFNTKEIITYTESSNPKNIISEPFVNTGEIEERLITKNFSKADLEQVKKELAEKGVKLKFNGIKRNSENEITAIKIEAKSDSASANFNTSSDEPIEPIVIRIDTENNKISIGNSSATNIHFNKDYNFVLKKAKHKENIHEKGKNVFVYSHSDDNDGNHEIIEDDDKIIIKSGNKIHEIKKVHTDKNVFVISGDTLEIEKLDGEIIELEADTIHFKGNIVTKEHKHKDGNVKIWTGDNENVYELKTIDKKGNYKFFISNSDGKKPMFILDGKEITSENIDDIDPNTIESINVLKGAAAIKLYGNKGKDGVIVITTKKKN